LDDRRRGFCAQRFVVCFLGELCSGRRIVQCLRLSAEQGDRLLVLGFLLQERLGLDLVVPELRGAAEILYLGDPVGSGVDVKDAPGERTDAP
jgi:hypothetical protein